MISLANIDVGRTNNWLAHAQRLCQHWLHMGGRSRFDCSNIFSGKDVARQSAPAFTICALMWMIKVLFSWGFIADASADSIAFLWHVEYRSTDAAFCSRLRCKMAVQLLILINKMRIRLPAF